MAKLVTYICLMGGLMMLFYFMGLTQCAENNPDCHSTVLGVPVVDPFTILMDMWLRPENIQSSGLVVAIVAVLGGISVMLTFILSRFISNIDMVITAPIAALLLSLFLGFSHVVVIVSKVNSVLAALIFSPLLLIFVLSVYEWFRGMQ